MKYLLLALMTVTAMGAGDKPPAPPAPAAAPVSTTLSITAPNEVGSVDVKTGKVNCGNLANCKKVAEQLWAELVRCGQTAEQLRKAAQPAEKK